jgi:hypothetical protein
MSESNPIVKFKGLCKYAQVYPGQERAPHPDSILPDKSNAEDKHFEILVECSEELFKKLKKAGIPAGTTLKEFEDEKEKYIKLKSTQKRREWTFEPPTVTNESDEPFTDLIGNGSTIEAYAELAPIKGRSGKVLRLKKIKVLEHITYEPKKPEVISEYNDNGLFE